LVTDPDLILADEPTGNLDSTSTADVLALFGELHGAGRTIILITHEADVAARASRVIRIHDGALVPEPPAVQPALAPPMTPRPFPSGRFPPFPRHHGGSS
jgi:putative ABC transport system ATP-binding protein